MKLSSITKLIGISVFALVVTGCGGGGGDSSSGTSPTNPTNPTPQPPSYSLFSPPTLPIATKENPYKIDYNVFQIDFTGKTYIEFTTTQNGKLLFKSSGYGYSDTKFELYEYGTDNIIPIESGDELPAGKYVMKVYNDKTPSTGVYFSILSNSFQGVTLAEMPVQNGISATTNPSFLSFWKFNVTSDKCIRVNGQYQYVYLYDAGLEDTGLDLDNNTECLSTGLYYLYYRNHTRYSQPFELVVD